ncbi:MAG: 5-oxoprolinase subunit PxpB [Chitinophagaceae bacterium]
MRHQRIYHLSERAITIEWQHVIDKHIHQHIMALDQDLKKNPFPGWMENVPSYHTLTIYYDPFSTETDPLHLLEDRLNHFIEDKAVATRKLKVPVCYDPAYAIDMPLVTKQLGLSAEEVIRFHLEQTYSVFMIGFMPGFPYMGKLNPKLFIERKAIPSKAIPAGSVAIAGFQTGIYPFESPGGWYVIGRTPWKLFENGKSTFEPGDEIEFEQISHQQMKDIINKMNHEH